MYSKTFDSNLGRFRDSTGRFVSDGFVQFRYANEFFDTDCFPSSAKVDVIAWASGEPAFYIQADRPWRPVRLPASARLSRKQGDPSVLAKFAVAVALIAAGVVFATQ